jgi:hypothetical protein
MASPPARYRFEQLTGEQLIQRVLHSLKWQRRKDEAANERRAEVAAARSRRAPPGVLKFEPAAARVSALSHWTRGPSVAPWRR